MIKAVIFDWGGVIAEENNGGWLAQFKSATGLDGEEALALFSKAYQGMNTGETSEDTFWKRAESLLGVTVPEDKKDIWSNGLADKAWPEMISFVKELKNNGLAVALLSNTIPTLSRRLRAENLYKDFDPVVLSDEVGISKPDPRIYQIVLERLGLQANDCIFVDDKSANIKIAEKLGMLVVHVQGNPKKTIRKISHIIGSA